MIRPIPGLPDHVLGFEASGIVSAADYESVLIPAVDAATSAGKKLRLLYHLGPKFEKFDFGAMWDDAKVGLRHLTSWQKVALVTDVDWIRASARVFGFALPGHVKVFDNTELAAAKAWLSE